MSEAFFFLLAAALFVAVQLRDSFAFTLLYFFGGVYLLSRAWSAYSLRRVAFRREFIPRAFPEERVRVRLHIHNAGLLPIPWLRLQDGLPVELTPEGSFQRVVSLGARQSLTLAYDLHPRQRGLFPVGPLSVETGDLLGLTAPRRSEGGQDFLTVYPRLVPLPTAHLPSRAPLGTLAHHQPIFEDPTRPVGKRPYQDGDSLRRVDWKASAAQGRLQVRLFEPSIALGALLALNLDARDYPLRSRRDASELAVTAAASLAQWSISRGQAAGLWVYGRDPLADSPAALPVRKGGAHLMRLLETLARVQATEMPAPFARRLLDAAARLPWGATLVVLTPRAETGLFEALFAIRRRGVQSALLLCGDVPGVSETRARAARFGIPCHYLPRERDLAAALALPPRR